MFSHDMEERRRGNVDILDLDSDTVHDMIIYIYSGKVGKLEGKATGLLSAAEKYDLKVKSIGLCDTFEGFNLISIFEKKTFFPLCFYRKSYFTICKKQTKKNL